MSCKKTKIAFFTVPEYEKEQDWLRKQHENGWKLIGATLPCFYHFEKCENEDVLYQLDYNKDGLENRSEYIQMFQDCGWEYITEMVGYSYFRKPVSQLKENEGIFCDDESRLDMINRVFKGKIIPLIVIFFCCIVPQLFLQYNVGRNVSYILFGMFVGLFILYVILFIQFGIQFCMLKKRIRR